MAHEKSLSSLSGLSSEKREQALRLSLMITDYSRAITGYELSFIDPSAMKTALCLRMA